MGTTDKNLDGSGSGGSPSGSDGWHLDSASATDPTVTKFESDLYDVLEEAAALLITKHRDYGPKNIALAPGGPLNGLRVRMWDKMARINNLIDSGHTPEHESLKDSFIDMANYSLIACMVLNHTWPTGE
jgi:hypothetical protein